MKFVVSIECVSAGSYGGYRIPAIMLLDASGLLGAQRRRVGRAHFSRLDQPECDGEREDAGQAEPGKGADPARCLHEQPAVEPR